MTDSTYKRLAWLLIALGAILRMATALTHWDLVHQDEHFQTLEPASWVVYGFGWKSWEWGWGLRSWFVPSLYIPVLFMMKALGVIGGLAPILACRALTAGASIWSLTQFKKLLEGSKFQPWAILLSLAFFSLSPAMIAWSAATLSDTWALIFLWGFLPLTFEKLAKSKKRDWVLAGFLAGFTFLVRIQTTVWSVGFLALVFFKQRKRFWPACAGFALAVLAQGLLDWITWEIPFHSVITNLEASLVKGVASFYGTAPWDAYFSLVPQNLGWTPIAVAIASLIALLASKKKSKVTPRDMMVLIPSLLFVAAHMAIAHKETRFLLPIYPAIFYCIAWGASAIELPLKRDALIAAPAFLALAFYSWKNVYTPEHYNSGNMSELALAIHDDGGLSTGRCWLLVNHYWVWSHGELLQGQHVNWIESKPEELKPQDLQNCIYAVVVGGRTEQIFREKAGASWNLIARNPWGYALYKH